MNFAQNFGNSVMNVILFVFERVEKIKTLHYLAKQQKSSIFHLSRKELALGPIT